MAGILQLRRGLKSTYISEGTNLAEAFFVTTEETGSISANNLIIGVSGSVGDDVITLAKLSLANKDNSYADYNSGSFWITGDYTGSNMILYRNAIISGSAFIEGDLHLEGHLFLGSGSDDDVVRVQSEFSGSIIPDNDITGSTLYTSSIAYYDLGSDQKRYRNIYLQKDVPSGSNGGFLSGSHIDLTGNIVVDNLGRFGTLRVDDLADNRILVTGPSGQVEHDDNLQWDGDVITIFGDYVQRKNGGSFIFDGAGMDITGSISNFQLRENNGIVFTNELGTLDNQNEFTWDGGTQYVDGNISASQTLEVDGHSSLASLTVEDLIEDRIVIVDANGRLGDDAEFRFTGNDFIIGSMEHFKVNRLTGNTFISGAVQMYSTLNVDDQSTLASVNVEDLTDNRVVIVGAGGEIEDDGNFTFNGTELNIGTGNFTVQQSSGDTQILGTLDVDSQSTLSSLNVEDLTSGRVVLAGTDGEIEDSENLTFNGSLLTVTGDTTITGNLTVQGDTTTLNVGELVVEDKNIVIASGAIDAAAANGAGITIEGANATLTYESSTDWFTFNKDTQVQGDLYVTNDISSSTVNGIGNVEIYSASVDSRLDYLEGPFSTSVDVRLDTIEGPISTSLDLRLLESFSTASDHEIRVIDLELTGSDHETRIDLIETTYATTGSNTFNGDQTISGSLILSGSATFTGSVDITGDYQINGTSYSSSLFESASISGSIIELTKGDSSTHQLTIPKGLGYSGLGWARYDDTTYTTASAFTITDGNTDIIPCNASGSIETHMHSTVSFYTGSGQYIQAENDGDVYSITVTFNMRATTNPADGDFVRLRLQTIDGTPYDRVRKDLFFSKNDNSWHSFHEVFQYYADTDFVTYGNQFKLTPSGFDIEIADVIIFIQRTQNHSQH